MSKEKIKELGVVSHIQVVLENGQRVVKDRALFEVRFGKMLVDSVSADKIQIFLCRGETFEIESQNFFICVDARDEKRQFEELQKIKEAAKLARRLGLGVNAGHGLNYLNVIPITMIEEIEELSIGHAIVARAIFVGFERAVREKVRLVKGI